ncbi:MAG: hypothetical protein QNJ74_04405 [Trichodesmium sp. MO_231.B1]|nr:hypothetical protein [Trichodesmium sp. MO_231.B1]
MNRRPEDLRQLFKGILSNDSDTHKRAKDKLSRWLWQHPKIGIVVKKSFSQINFGDSSEFYDNSLQETFLKFDSIIKNFLRKNQITFEKLDNISEQKLSVFWIRYFNRAHFNKACDLYRQWERETKVDGQVIISLDQPKNDVDGQEYSTVGEKIKDHKNLNDLDNFNLGNLSQEAIDRLSKCCKKVDCFEILLLKCQGYNQTEIAEKLGVHQSNISRNWNDKCLKCINQIIAENNIELQD